MTTGQQVRDAVNRYLDARYVIAHYDVLCILLHTFVFQLDFKAKREVDSSDFYRLALIDLNKKVLLLHIVHHYISFHGNHKDVMQRLSEPGIMASLQILSKVLSKDLIVLYCNTC